MPRFSIVTLSLAVAACGAIAPPSRAQESVPPSEEAAGVAQRVSILERKLEIQEQTAAEKSAAAAIFAAGKDGFSWKSADGAYVLKLRGYFHADGRFFTADDERPATSSLLVRRIRPIIEATVAKSFDLRIMPDWGGGTAVLQDGYVEYRLSPKLKWRAGKFKPPVGSERLQSATEIVFVERALPTNLVPNRDIGLQVSGDVADTRLSYALGIFDGVADGGSADGDTNDHKEWAGRLYVWPFKNAMSRILPGLGVGIAASVGENQGTATAPGLGSLRSTGQQTIFSYLSDGQAVGTVVAAGRRLRWSPSGSWYVGRLGTHGEYVESSQEIRLGANRREHSARAWQFTGSFLLTGDAYTARGVSPKNAFDSATGTWGAVALDGRVSNLVVEGDAFPIFANPNSSITEANAWAAGVSWFLSRNVKLVVDYEETTYEGGAAAGEDRETEKVLFTRTQFSF